MKSAPSRSSRHPPTMKDVARLAGVSPSTVSLVLRNAPSISEPTRKRVLRIQQKLGYHVNRYAHEFVRHTRGRGISPRLERVEFFLVDIDMSLGNESYSPFLQGIIAECRNRNLLLSLRSIKTDAQNALTAPQPFAVSHADGLIISGHLNDDILSTFRQLGLPLIVLGNYLFSQKSVGLGMVHRFRG